jgi:hypothetical protein
MHFGRKLPHKCLCVLPPTTQEKFIWPSSALQAATDLWRNLAPPFTWGIISENNDSEFAVLWLPPESMASG